MLDLHPHLWKQCYDVVTLTEQAWIGRIAGTDLVLSQSIRRRVELLKSDLGGPSPSPLEKILAERIAACWLGVHHAELNVAAVEADGKKVAEVRCRQLDSANKRFLSAVKALAQVRRLANGIRIEIAHTGGVTPQGTPAEGGRISNNGAEGVQDRLGAALASDTKLESELCGSLR